MVALVPVADLKVRFWRVVEARARNWAVEVAWAVEESPRVVESWMVKFPAMVVAPWEVEPVRTKLLP